MGPGDTVAGSKLRSNIFHGDLFLSDAQRECDNLKVSNRTVYDVLPKSIIYIVSVEEKDY